MNPKKPIDIKINLERCWPNIKLSKNVAMNIKQNIDNKPSIYILILPKALLNPSKVF